MPGTDSLLLPPAPTDSLNPKDGKAPAAAPAILPPGTIIDGHEIVRFIGEGSNGRVYEARGPDGEHVALKLLKSAKASDPDAVRDFLNEAEATGAVRHENVVRVFGHGLADGHDYIRMEYVDGPNLHRLLARKKRLPWRAAVEIVVQVAKALACAHGKGFIHRDVKPENILLYRDGRARLTDFGIVKDIGSLKGFLLKGEQVGTALYASPEQVLGKRLDRATDMYSLGATLYHMVCGRYAFTGKTPQEILRKHAEEPLVPPCGIVADIPKSLSNLIVKMMAKKQTDRVESMDRLVRDLETILAGKVVLTDEAPRADTTAVKVLRAARRPVEEPGRKRAVSGEAILVAVLLAAAAVVAALALL